MINSSVGQRACPADPINIPDTPISVPAIGHTFITGRAGSGKTSMAKTLISEYGHRDGAIVVWISPIASGLTPAALTDRLTAHAQEVEDAAFRPGRHSNKLIPASEEPYKAYSFLEHIQEFFTKHGQGRTFTGHLLCDEGGAGDLWRVAIVDGEVVTTSAVCLWPEDVQCLQDALDYYEYDSEGIRGAVSEFLLAYSSEARKPRP